MSKTDGKKLLCPFFVRRFDGDKEQSPECKELTIGLKNAYAICAWHNTIGFEKIGQEFIERKWNIEEALRDCPKHFSKGDAIKRGLYIE